MSVPQFNKTSGRTLNLFWADNNHGRLSKHQSITHRIKLLKTDNKELVISQLLFPINSDILTICFETNDITITIYNKSGCNWLFYVWNKLFLLDNYAHSWIIWECTIWRHRLQLCLWRLRYTLVRRVYQTVQSTMSLSCFILTVQTLDMEYIDKL